jgi:hypothetical protein
MLRRSPAADILHKDFIRQMSALSTDSLPVIFVASLVAFFLAVEAGHFLGSRTEEGKNVATLEAAVLGLLALMIGFTFSMALNRFEARRDALMTEANAIGTAALRARLLPAPYGEESLKLFRDYARIRVDFGEREQTSEEAAQALRRSRELHEALWRQAQGAAAKDNALVPTGLYIQALNEAFDSHQKRLTILANRVPRIVFVTLYCVAVGALWLAGFASASDKARWRLPTYVPCLLVAGVILLIQDLDRPGGFITVGQQPMIDAAEALDGYASLPRAAPAPAPTSAPTVKSVR